MPESSGEKTLAPSEQRLKDAARDGDVLRSRELGTAATVIAGAAFLRFAGPWLLGVLSQSMRIGLTWDRVSLDDFSPERLMMTLGALAVPPVLVLGGCVIAATLISQLGVAGPGRWNFANIAPKPSRIDPLAGLSRMFGVTGGIEVAKGLVKVGLLGGIAYGWGRSRVTALAGLSAVNLSGQLGFAWAALTSLFLALAAGLVVIALSDFPVQWLRRHRRLRMSRQDQRDEHKDSEGSPQKKQAIRQRQRQLAISGVAAAMRKAQFVITNPTHFAIAMTYDPALAPAPVVLAKGRGEKALAMRELAAEHGLPMLEFPALARSVYYTTRERQMIREELYAAVAGVLTFVLALKRGDAPPGTKHPNSLIEVPVALRFDTDGQLDPEAAG